MYVIKWASKMMSNAKYIPFIIHNNNWLINFYNTQHYKKSHYVNWKMLSPKMQRSVRVNDTQLLHLADRAQYDHSMVSSQSETCYLKCVFSLLLLCVFVYEKKSKWQNSNENYTGNHINYTRIYRQILNFMGRLFFKVVAVGDTIPRNKTIHSQAFQCEKRIFFYWRQRNENKASKLVCNQKILFSLNSGGLFDFLYLLFFFILEKFLNGSCLILKLILLPPHYGKSTFKKSL